MSDSHDSEPTPRDPDMPMDALGLGDPSPQPSVSAASAPAVASQPYRVLARKYRPQRFDELIGQDAMVKTLGNAIKRDRIAHAFLMTGVRGVGKTTTARLIAKALNCIGEDGQGGPTISPCDKCEPCTAIAEGRFIDVMEQDAASKTKVEEMRELLDGIPYAATSARYKVYIIDEVHMLSNHAFNALLKTLEEPPPHVKFIFATTEVKKVPITVLSRCQRFDLKRITADMLSEHFAKILEKEGVQAEDEALALIAQAAEGSVRDGLSILDQAIAHADMEGDGKVIVGQVRDMLGLSDRSAVRRLFALLLEGDAAGLLDAIKQQHMLGVEPLNLMSGLLRIVHSITLAKAGKNADATQSDEERSALADWAGQLSFPQLHRLWQLMLKGHGEVQSAALTMEACEMALLRVIHAGQMPDPGELAKMIANGGSSNAASGAPQAQNAGGAGGGNAPSQQMPQSFDELIMLFENSNKIALEGLLKDAVRVVEYAPSKLIYQLSAAVHDGFASELREALFDLTGARWHVEQGEGQAAPSVMEMKQQAKDDERAAILETPLVKAAMAAFPDATLKDYDEIEVRSASA